MDHEIHAKANPEASESTSTSQRRRLGTIADRGASLVEYALLVALIAIVCVSALQVLGGSLSDRIEGDAGRLEQAGN
jgi:Flp pilus assembly pilin Flp